VLLGEVIRHVTLGHKTHVSCVIESRYYHIEGEMSLVDIHSVLYRVCAHDVGVMYIYE